MTAGEKLQRDLILWYAQPAKYWYDGLPLANGRMGAMVLGGVRVEHLYLSETTFWSGEPSHENNPPNGSKIISEIRQHLLARNVDAANQLAHFLEGRRLNYGTNLPFGNLRIIFNHLEGDERDYRRELDLDEGIVKIQYREGDVVFKREMFVSAPHQVVVLRLTSSKPENLTFRVILDGDEQPFTVCSEGVDTLLLDTQARETQHSDGKVGVDGHARLWMQADGGALRPTASQIMVENANSVTLFLAIGTTFGGKDPQKSCLAQVEAAARITYKMLRQAHVAEHQNWFRRCSLDLGANLHPDWPLDRRLDAARNGEDDPHLCALLFQMGRYLLIGSSRPDSPLPAHLTGAWNDNKACRIAWTCDYHLDINTQMNYWIAELTGMGDCCQPLFHWMEHTLVPAGRETALKLYDLPGWVAHIFSNSWGFTALGWSTAWGVFPTGGVWAAMHLWDHYRFSEDRQFLLETAYPILKEAAEFCLAYLFNDPQTGWLVTGPANSPENEFLYQGKAYPVALSPTVDRVLIEELFLACIQSSEVLSIDDHFCMRLKDAKAKLVPYQIGRHGQLQEWLADYDEAVPGHRHTSHLLGLYPFAQITPRHTPVLAHAAQVSIDRRVNAPGYEEGGWARNQITLYYARLGDGEAAYHSYTTLFRKEAGDSLFTGTRLAPANAYEMDYNTGASAGIAEMLMQSHAGYLSLLPALPKAWAEGSVNGLRARGGFEIDIRWKDHRLIEGRIRSLKGNPCIIRSTELIHVLCEGLIVPVETLPDGELVFQTQSEQVYILSV